MVRSKLDNESFLEHKQRVLDTKSASFCGYNVNLIREGIEIEY